MKKIVWGILLLAAAVVLLLMELGVGFGSVIAGFSVMDIVLSAVLLAIAINFCIDRNWDALPFVFAVMFCVLESDIARLLGRADENLVNNWVIFICALASSIGISLLISPFKKHKRKHKKKGKEFSFSFNSEDEDGVKMSSASKYFDCATHSRFFYRVHMGDGNLYFTNTENVQGDLYLTVYCHMGNMDIYVPHQWRIQNNVHAKLGVVSEPDNTMAGNGPLLVIDGENKMGNIDIHYI